MPVTPESFAEIFPEFGENYFPTPQVEFYIAEGYAQLSQRRLKDRLDYAVMLFAGHKLSLAKRAKELGESGGRVGDVVAPIASKSVDKVSVGFSTSETATDGAGEWNATSYGQQLWTLLRQYNAGPVYVPGPRRIFNPPFPLFTIR